MPNKFFIYGILRRCSNSLRVLSWTTTKIASPEVMHCWNAVYIDLCLTLQFSVLMIALLLVTIAENVWMILSKKIFYMSFFRWLGLGTWNKPSSRVATLLQLTVLMKNGVERHTVTKWSMGFVHIWHIHRERFNKTYTNTKTKFVKSLKKSIYL